MISNKTPPLILQQAAGLKKKLIKIEHAVVTVPLIMKQSYN